MKNVFVALIGIILIFAPYSIYAELSKLSDDQMEKTTGQAGFSQIVEFDQAFSNGKNNNNSSNSKVSFDDAFANGGNTANSDSVNFDQAFEKSKTKINDDGSVTQNINLAGVEMKNVSFDQAFSKATGVDLGIGKAVGADVKMDIKINSGSINVRYNR